MPKYYSSIPDSENSIRRLGLFLAECRREFRNCDHSVQSAWCSRTRRPSKLTTEAQALLAGEILWITAVTFIRASVILLYIWIFSKPPFRLVCYGILTINFLYFTGTVLACCLICRPLAYSWNRSIHGTCGDQKSVYLFIGVFNLLMDVTTVALPLPVLWGLQMPTGRKIALSVLFSMGIAYECPLSAHPGHLTDLPNSICIITLVRIKVTSDINATNSPEHYALISLLTCLEASLGVINACLPVTRPVFDKLKPDSLISALSSWTRGVTSHDYEMPAMPKEITWPVKDKVPREPRPERAWRNRKEFGMI